MQHNLQKLAELTKAKLHGDPHHLIQGVEDLALAKSSDASFLSNTLYTSQLKTTQAGVICIDPTTDPIPGKNFLISENPSVTFQQLIKIFFAPATTGFQGIHPTAVIHPTAKLAPN